MAKATGQASDIEEVEFAGKGKILLQKPIGRGCVRRVGQHSLVVFVADFAPGAAWQVMHDACRVHHFDTHHGADKHFIERHGAHPVAMQVQAQGVQCQFIQSQAL